MIYLGDDTGITTKTVSPQKTVVSTQIVPRPDQSVLDAHLDTFIRKRCCEQNLIGRIAWTIWISLLMLVGWAIATMDILENRSWDPVDLIALDGGILVLGVGILLLIWVMDD